MVRISKFFETAIGYLFYYEKFRSFIIELYNDLDEWEAPLLFQKLVREQQYTVPREIALMWVKGRIIWECFPTEDDHLVCLFQDDLAVKIDLHKLVKYHKSLRHAAVLQTKSGIPGERRKDKAGI